MAAPPSMRARRQRFCSPGCTLVRPFRAPLSPLVPVLGILTCLMLMFSLHAENWWRLLGWLALGLVIYFTYSRHHSVMARSGAKTWLARHAPPPLERSIYVWFASILLVGVTLLWRRVPGTVYVLTGSAAGLGWLLQAAGLALTAAGARVLSARALAGIHQAAGTAERGDIRMVWPYTLVRHPIYLGWALIMFGAPAMTVDRFVWAVVSTGYLILAMPWEERSLSAAAGPAYSAYCRRVRWRMVPGLY